MKAPSKFFRGFAYDTPEQMAAFLDRHPQLVAEFLDAQLGLIRMCALEGEMQSPREFLADALEAIAIHREHNGKSVLR